MSKIRSFLFIVGKGQDRKGYCVCDPGWTGDDCAIAACLHNCSSTPEVFRGYCLHEFPAEQCICQEGYGGLFCERKLCLNNCSGNGRCLEDGTCLCDKPYYTGVDCSVLVFEPGRTAHEPPDFVSTATSSRELLAEYERRDAGIVIHPEIGGPASYGAY